MNTNNEMAVNLIIHLLKWGAWWGSRSDDADANNQRNSVIAETMKQEPKPRLSAHQAPPIDQLNHLDHTKYKQK